MTALIRAGLVKSLSVTGVSVPHNVPDFMFMTPAKHWADDDVGIISREGGRMGVPFEILPAGAKEWLPLFNWPDEGALLTITDGFNDHVGVT